MSDRRERAREILRRVGADALVAAHPSTVAWLTGYAAEIETGPSPFALAPLAVLTDDGGPILVVAADEAEAAAATGCEVLSYRGFALGPLDPVGGARRVLAGLLDGARVAGEPGVLPAALAEGIALVDVAAELARARAVKDADELERIRAAIALCDAGQREARAQARPGLTELDLWSAVRAAIERAAGARTPVLADLVSGPRTAEVGGAPGERRLDAGDLVLCDLVPRRDGYWGDCCATIAVGEADATARAHHRAAREALARGVEAVRPGIAAGDLDALVREHLDYPHHTGHGVGTSFHEEPRIVPGSPTRLEAGMVVALEPAVYGDGVGVRVEQVVVVTEGGCELLSGHELEL
jgi:Xaa-Pro aminopeptidase